MSAYNSNSTQKLNAFNENATQKTEDFDEHTEEIQDNIEKLQTENERLKATLPTTTGEGQDITLNKTAELEFKKPPLPRGNSEQGILPEQYQQVEYIESTGTQYINTNYTPVENDDINIEKVKKTGTGCLFSAGNSTNQLILLASSSTNYYWKYFAAGNATAFFTEELSNFSTISIANGSISINNVVKASSTYAGTVDTTIQLFRRVNGESYATASIGRFTITNGNKTKLDLIPCYRISDNEVGMYDLVSNTFYTNAGTGTFNKGNNTPNPDYPQEITNVTGDVEVKVQNKNLFEQINYSNQTLNNRTLTNNNGIITINGTGTLPSNFEVPINITPTEDMCISISKISGEINGTIQFVFISSDGTPITSEIGSSAVLTQGVTYTIARISVRPNAICTNLVIGCQIEKGSTSTPYTPHKEQVLPLTLGNIELCKIGDYQDYFYKESNKWYLHKEIEKEVLNGTQNIAKNDSDSSNYLYYMNLGTRKIGGTVLSNKLTYKTLGQINGGNDVDTVGISTLSTSRLFYFNLGYYLTVNTVAGVNSYLTGNNITVYYQLEEPVNTEITDTTLISQLEAINNALSYEEQTNISSNQNALFNVEAYQDSKVILAEKYVKPDTGIPKTDLASAVQTSLGKADTALQSHQDISGKANKISVVQTSASTIEINSNTFYKFGEVASLNITLASITDNTIYNEYMFEFVSGTTATTLTLPSSIKWLETPTIDANKIYQCSIVDNVGLLVGVTNV